MDDLKLVKGEYAYAVVKASDVMIGIDWGQRAAVILRTDGRQKGTGAAARVAWERA